MDRQECHIVQLPIVVVYDALYALYAKTDFSINQLPVFSVVLLVSKVITIFTVTRLEESSSMINHMALQRMHVAPTPSSVVDTGRLVSR